MASSRLSLAIVLSVLGLGAALAIAALVAAPSRCAKQLFHLGAVITQYRLDHGSYPTAWTQLPELPSAITRCPSGGQLAYDFLDLARLAPSALERCPLLVDPSLANHGSGIHILFSDSHVEWDAGRTTLSTFLSAHPEIPYQLR
jgi:hypothetical protein